MFVNNEIFVWPVYSNHKKIAITDNMPRYVILDISCDWFIVYFRENFIHLFNIDAFRNLSFPRSGKQYLVWNGVKVSTVSISVVSRFRNLYSQCSAIESNPAILLHFVSYGSGKYIPVNEPYVTYRFRYLFRLSFANMNRLGV